MQIISDNKITFYDCVENNIHKELIFKKFEEYFELEKNYNNFIFDNKFIEFIEKFKNYKITNGSQKSL